MSTVDCFVCSGRTFSMRESGSTCKSTVFCLDSRSDCANTYPISSISGVQRDFDFRSGLPPGPSTLTCVGCSRSSLICSVRGLTFSEVRHIRTHLRSWPRRFRRGIHPYARRRPWCDQNRLAGLPANDFDQAFDYVNLRLQPLINFHFKLCAPNSNHRAGSAEFERRRPSSALVDDSTYASQQQLEIASVGWRGLLHH